MRKQTRFGLSKVQKRLMVYILTCAIFVSLAGCSKVDPVVSESADKICGAFSVGNIDEINGLVFGAGLYSRDPLQEEVPGEEPLQEGILGEIFNNVSVSTKKVTDEKITYEISAPDLRNVFLDMADDLNIETEKDLLNYIVSYMENTGVRQETVSLEYTLSDGALQIDYQDEAFVNAITGGLLDAYKSLYADILEEITKGVQAE